MELLFPLLLSRIPGRFICTDKLPCSLNQSSFRDSLHQDTLFDAIHGLHLFSFFFSNNSHSRYLHFVIASVRRSLLCCWRGPPLPQDSNCILMSKGIHERGCKHEFYIMPKTNTCTFIPQNAEDRFDHFYTIMGCPSGPGMKANHEQCHFLSVPICICVMIMR